MLLCPLSIPKITIVHGIGSGGAGAVPAQKFGLFVTAGGPTAASFADRLLAHTQQAFADTPLKQKHPCFRRRWLLQVCLGKAFPTEACQRFAQGQPKGYFQTKVFELLLYQFSQWKKGGEGCVCWELLRYDAEIWWVQRANMCKLCSLSAVQRKTACVEQSWWPEFDMFGSMPWCSFPWHKLLPMMLAQKNCHTTVWIWSMSSHPRLRLKVIVAGLPEKAFPQKHAFVDISVFLCCASNAKDSPKASRKAIFNQKCLNYTAKPIFPMKERCGRLRMLRYDEFNVPTCANFAVCQLCRERQPVWNSHDGLNLTCLDQCHSVRSHGTSSSQGWRKIIVIQSTV